MNISIALKLWGNPTSGSKDACICSFGWVFYCKIEEIKRSGQRAGNDGEKIYIHSRRYLRAFFFFLFWISSTSRRSDDATYSIYKTDYNSGKRFRAL